MTRAAVDRRFGGWSARGGARTCTVLLACAVVASALGVVAILAGSVAIAAVGVSSAPSFAPTRHYAVGGRPTFVAIGDLDRDGKADLVTANPDAKRLSVLINRGDGNFRRVDRAAERKPSSIATGDLNGDENLDLVTANSAADTVSVLLGEGDGRFRPDVEYPTGRGPVSVAIGELNGDGRPDVAVANGAFRVDTVSTLLNRGDGSFEAKRDYATGPGPVSVAIGDLNGDRRQDLAVANHSFPTVSVLFNQGDGSFEARTDYRTPAFASSVAIGDLDNDGKSDLVTSNLDPDCIPDPRWATCSNNVAVFLNRAGGWLRRHYDTGPEPSSVVIGDLNGDGNPDLATVNREFLTDTASVLANKGDGSFRPRLDYRTARNPSSLAIGDLNGDGRLDLATANGDPRTVSVFLNRPGLCTVQIVNDRPLPFARRVLARANCRVGKIRHAHSKHVRRGRVSSQRPGFGAVLRGGGKVNLVVSRGRKR